MRIAETLDGEAFGTGAAFALIQLAGCPPGFYTFDDLLLELVRLELRPEERWPADMQPPDSA